MHGFPMMFGISTVIFIAVFALVILVFVFTGLRGLQRGMSNNNQPLLYDHVQVVDKRTHVWGSSGHHSRTSCYITFEFEDGQRHELMVPSSLYGQTAARDVGTLTWQGTRFHDFQRARL